MHVIFQLSSTTALSEKRSCHDANLSKLRAKAAIFRAAPRQCRSEEYSAFEDRALQGFATIGVRRASVGIVPRRSTAIADFGLGLVPGPQFHQRVHPEVQMISAEVRPEVAKLLLAGPPDFLDVVEDLFDGRPVGERFQDLPHARLRIGREEELAAVGFLNDQPRGSCRKPDGRWPGSFCTS